MESNSSHVLSKNSRNTGSHLNTVNRAFVYASFTKDTGSIIHPNALCNCSHDIQIHGTDFIAFTTLDTFIFLNGCNFNN